jgi:hypothetical protein
MIARTLAALTMAGVVLLPSAASAQQGERRCYFGECPDDQSPQPPPPANVPKQMPQQVPQQMPQNIPPGPSTADDLPHFCCTVMGPLGPYPNPDPYGVAPVGSACYGTAYDGMTYQGTACYGNEQPTTATMPAAPNFCCTVAGRFGPFPNPGWPEGSACWSETVFGPLQGLACY